VWFVKKRTLTTNHTKQIKRKKNEKGDVYYKVNDFKITTEGTESTDDDVNPGILSR